MAAMVAGCGGGGATSSSAPRGASTSANAGGGTVAVEAASVSSAPADLGSFAPIRGLGGTVPKKTIGLVNVQGTSPSAARCQAQFERAAKTLGWSVKSADAQGDPARMAADVNAMVTSNVDAIVTVAVEASAAQQGLQQARARRIPTIAYCGALTPSPLYSANYAPNDAQVAAASVRYMMDDLGNSGDVVAQFYSPIAALDRRDQVARAMLAGSGVNLVASHQVDLANPIQDTTSSTLSMLRAHPGVRAVLVDQDFEFPTVAQAVASQHLNVKVYGMYGGDDAFAALRKGGAAAAFSNSAPDASAWTAADQLLQYFVNTRAIEPLAGYDHPYPVTLVTAKNVSQTSTSLFPDYGPLYIAQWRAEGYRF